MANISISELFPTVNFGPTDEFVIVQDNRTVRINGIDVIHGISTMTNLATKSYVDAIVNGAPGTLDTLAEIASALNDDANFAGTITTLINSKLAADDFEPRFWQLINSSVKTANIPELNNLYFTTQRVLDVVRPLIPTSFVTSYNDLTNKPTLFSGRYTDLTNKPSIPTDINQLSDASGLLGQGNSGSYPTAPTFTTVTTTNLNVKNVAFTGTGAVTISSGNDLNFVAAGNITFNGATAITTLQLKAVVAASTDFADFKARIAAI
jgi:hypothetical protein